MLRAKQPKDCDAKLQGLDPSTGGHGSQFPRSGDTMVCLIFLGEKFDALLGLSSAVGELSACFAIHLLGFIFNPTQAIAICVVE